MYHRYGDQSPPEDVQLQVSELPAPVDAAFASIHHHAVVASQRHPHYLAILDVV